MASKLKSSRPVTPRPTQGQGSARGLKKRVERIIELCRRYYPDPECALVHDTPEELLVATILSAQCTDERVNQVTVQLFKDFPSVEALAKARLPDLEKAVKSTGFFKNKANNIKKASQLMLEKHQGRVPRTLDDLVELPGVGRKTANVVLGNAFGIASGVVVDTHVTRLSNRLGLVTTKNAQIIERKLQELVPKEHWIEFPHWMIIHGRRVCKARSPQCSTCFLEALCPKVGVAEKSPRRR